MVVHKPKTMVVGLPGSLFSYIHIIYMYVYDLAYSYPADPLIHQFNNNLSIYIYIYSIMYIYIYTILSPSKKRAQAFCVAGRICLTPYVREIQPLLSLLFGQDFENPETPNQCGQTGHQEQVRHIISEKIVEFGGV